MPEADHATLLRSLKALSARAIPSQSDHDAAVTTHAPSAPQLLSMTQPSEGWPRFIHPVACCHRAGLAERSAPGKPATMVEPSAEIAIDELNRSPVPRSR